MCVAKFGLGPRFEPFVPELPGEPIAMGEESEAEFQAKLKELRPDRDLDDPEVALQLYQTSLIEPSKPGQVMKLNDEELSSYKPEDYFGIRKEELEELRDIVSGRKLGDPPAIRTVRRLDRDSFIKLLVLQSRRNLSDLAFESMEIMQDLRMRIDPQVYTLVIASCYHSADVDRARGLFDTMLMEGVPLTVESCTAMMSCYSKNLQLDEAYTLMRTYALGPERTIEPDNAIFTTLIHGCLRKENYQLAWDTFDMMRQFYLEADTIAFTLMIDICARQYEAERAFNLFEEIKFLKLPMIDYTFNSMLKVCSRRHDYFNKGFEILREMKDHGFRPDAHSYHLLLASCGPVGNLKAADLIMDQMQTDKIPITIKSYEILLDVLSRSIQHNPDHKVRQTLIERADMIFKQLQQYAIDKNAALGANIIPGEHTITTKTLNSYLSVYVEAMHLRQTEGLIPLYGEFGLQPDTYTYTMLLKMFSKAKRVEQCFDIYRQMKQSDIVPNKFAWRHLMNVCARAKYFNNGFKILRLMISHGKCKEALHGLARLTEEIS